MSEQEVIISKYENHIATMLHRKADEKVREKLAEYELMGLESQESVRNELSQEVNLVLNSQFSFFGMQIRLMAQDRESIISNKLVRESKGKVRKMEEELYFLRNQMERTEEMLVITSQNE
jgi:hypothetical protein